MLTYGIKGDCVLKILYIGKEKNPNIGVARDYNYQYILDENLQSSHQQSTLQTPLENKLN